MEARRFPHASLEFEAREATLVRLFADAFDADDVGADDDFFALGGDSLIAERLVAEIERQLGTSLSISVLQEAPTPRRLAAVMSRKREVSGHRYTTQIRSGNGPILFCLHGNNGDSLFPYHLAELLDIRRPIHGFRAPGLERGEQLLTSVSAAADLYLPVVTSAQPQGPYLLLGHCGTGTMTAWEIAQRLEAAGSTVAGLILLDPAVEEFMAPFLYKSGLALGMSRSKAEKQIQEFVRWFDENPDADADARRKRVHAALEYVGATSLPQRLNCPTLLLCTTARRARLFDAEFGLTRLLDDCEPVVVHSSHKAIFHERISDTAAVIQRFLDRVHPLAGT
jgi:thioesterase domain-containing protein/acyl carrier protein